MWKNVLYLNFKLTINNNVNQFLKKLPINQMARKRLLSESQKISSTRKIPNMDTSNSTAVDKSMSDKKSYRVIKLENQLLALLISDPAPLETSSESADDSGSETSQHEVESEGSESEDEGDETAEKLAAAALCVNVGSFSEHGDIQGLSHFLEHMIFMGSSKYPLENEYDAYIKKCGGSDNADTNYEETSFYFEIAEKYLDGALDRFSQLFTEPLMLKDTMSREREAVDSEFQSKINSESARQNQLMAFFGHAAHPCTVFAWGNLKTLKDNIDDDTLYQRVHEFRKRHYSANRMTLCVQARLPLDVLEDLAVKHFSHIQNNQKPGIDFSQFNHQNAFTDEFFTKVCFIKPKADITKIDLTWCLPSMVKDYKCKPHHYIAYLLGYEGKGSLMAYLRNKEWALVLECGSVDGGFEHNSLFMLFGITVHLTDLGFENIDKVLSAIFAYLKLLKQFGANEKLFAELQQIEATSFRYQNEKTALDNVEDLVVNMHYFPPNHIITGPQLYFEFDAPAINNVINLLNVPTFNLMVTSSKPYKDVVYDKKEKWFGTEYTTTNMPEIWQHLWETSHPTPELHLPETNKYITTNFDILKNQAHGVLSEYPEKIVSTDILEMWYRQDTKFLLPFGYMYFYFITPMAMQSPKSSVMLSLFSLMCKHQLVEELYPATVAGLSYQLFSLEKGVVLRVDGYNEKLHLLVEKIINCMINLKSNMRESIFNMFKIQLAKNLFNIMIKPSNLNKDVRLSLVQKVHFSNHEKFNSLQSITFDDLKMFVDQMFDEIKIQALIQGNINEVTALEIGSSIQSQFAASALIKDMSKIETRTNRIPLGEHFISVQTFRQNDANTVITNFYQVGESSVSLMSMLDLLDLLKEDPLFDILRTKEQLGYDVSGSVRANYGILGYAIAVNSQEDKFNAAFVEERIEKFRQAFREILENMAIEEFELFKNSLIKLKLVEDTELKDEVARNWAEITTEDYIFDRLHREVEAIHKISKQNMIDFYHTLLDDSKNMRKLSVHVIGNEKGILSDGKEEANDEEIDYGNQKHLHFLNIGRKTTITNMDEFRKTLKLYPVTRTSLE